MGKKTIVANGILNKKYCDEHFQIALEGIAKVAEKHGLDKDVLLFIFLDYGIRSYDFRHMTLFKQAPSFNSAGNWIDKEAVLTEIEYYYVTRAHTFY